MKSIIKIYTLFFISIVISLAYLYHSTSVTEVMLQKNLENLFIKQAKEFSNNLKEYIQENIESDITNVLEKETLLRFEIEEAMGNVVTDSYKYIYVLYRDNKGDYRYLLDASTQDKGEFNQKFITEHDGWESVYSSQRPQLLHQSTLDTVWMTYLNPIVINNKVEAVLAMDFSVALPEKIVSATKPMEVIFYYIFASIVILLLILLYQTILNLKVKKASYTDSLTKVYNRHYLRYFLKNIDIDKYQVIMLDIDHFKKVNDNYGHSAGDYILETLAVLLKYEIRDGDIIIRFGGEEFLIFIRKEQSSNNTVIKVADRIAKSVNQKKFIYDSNEIAITLSMGITLNPEEYKNIHEAIKHADNMLYIAKNEGRNRIIYKREDIKLKEHTKNISFVKEAVEEGLIFCQFQPILSAKEKKIIKYEALVRIKDKDGSTVYPGAFLDAIVHTSVYKEMTKKVLEYVFTYIKKYSVQISVNLNFSDILDDDIYSLILFEMKENEQLASWLIVELLEYEPLEDSTIINERLLEIKSYGVKIAIDDFGSGFANYTIFNSIPIDIIKIDGSLIKNVNSSEISRKIVNSIVLLAKELNLETIAEFVHNEDVLQKVQELDVDLVQGFHLAKPSNELLKL